MKKLFISVIGGALLAACNGAAINTVNATLAQVANNDLPAACGIVTVAEGYFANVKGQVSGLALTREAQAAAVANAICANPPSNITQALVDMGAAWIAIQAATTVPGT
jgi:hypothetical protein